MNFPDNEKLNSFTHDLWIDHITPKTNFELVILDVGITNILSPPNQSLLQQIFTAGINFDGLAIGELMIQNSKSEVLNPIEARDTMRDIISSIPLNDGKLTLKDINTAGVLKRFVSFI